MFSRLPKTGEAMSFVGTPPFGFSKFGVLKTLKTSQRSSMLARSLTAIRLNSETSVLLYPGPVTMLRPAFPKRLARAGTRANALVLKNRFGVRSPRGRFGLPIKSVCRSESS